jgi:hypothetical protein
VVRAVATDVPVDMGPPLGPHFQRCSGTEMFEHEDIPAQLHFFLEEEATRRTVDVNDALVIRVGELQHNERAVHARGASPRRTVSPRR